MTLPNILRKFLFRSTLGLFSTWIFKRHNKNLKISSNVMKGYRTPIVSFLIMQFYEEFSVFHFAISVSASFREKA